LPLDARRKARGSIGLPTRRWLRTVSRDFSAAAGERRPHRRALARFVFEGEVAGMSACSCEAEAAVAASKPTAAGRSRYSSAMSFRCVLGERRGIATNERDGLPDVVDLAVRERRPEGLLLLLSPTPS